MQQEDHKLQDLNSSQTQERSSSANRPQSPFSPQNQSAMSNFFNPRGPIRPQNLFIQSMPEPANLHRGQSQQVRAQIPVSQMVYGPQQDEYDDYYGEEEGDQELAQQRGQSRVLTYEQENQIIAKLLHNSQRRTEFKKVLDILQNDEELRPLIFEHEALLNTLKEMTELKAEQMLSILTAAETEMYESTKQREEQKSNNQRSNVATESKAVEANLISAEQTQELLEKTQTATFEIEALKRQMRSLEQEKMLLTTELTKEKNQREQLQKEQECAFKNLTEENKQLKFLNETLKKAGEDTKKQLELKEREFVDEVSNLKRMLKQQEDLRVSMLDDKSKIESDLQKNQAFIDNLEKEIQLLEKDNENLHRKMNLTYNSLLFSHGLQHYGGQTVHQIQEQSTPARRNLSNSFQASMNTEGLIKTNNSVIIHQGQSTQKLKLLMSENKSANSFVANSLYYAHHFGGHQKTDLMPRSNSIEVILLEDEESRKQNMYQIGEEEKQPYNASYVLQNKASWLKTKGLFTDLSPIHSMSSQNQDQTSRRTNSYHQRQQYKKLHDVEEEQTEILGTHTASPYQPTRYYDEQVRKLQVEIEKLKEQNNELTQKLQSHQYVISGTQLSNDNESPSHMLHKRQPLNDLIFGTPQQTNNNYKFNHISETGQSHFNYISNNQNQQHIGGSNEPSPMMATFSKEKDRQFYTQFNQLHSQQSSLPKGHHQSESERERYLEQQYERLAHEFKAKLQELGTRLLAVLRKVNGQLELSQFQNQEFSVSLLKDLIYEIGTKVDFMVEANQRSRVMSQGVHFPPQMFYGGQGSSGFNLQPPSHGFGSHNNSTTMDMTDLRNMLLEEKEKRLLVQEELNKTKEQHLRFISENEKLKQELFNEKHQNQSMVLSHYDYHNQSFDQVNKLNQTLQQKLDQVQDENISLKLKIAELEDDLLSERQNKQIKYETNLESFKSSIQGQYLDQKIRYEEQLLAEKDTSHKLKVEIKGLLERNDILKEQLALFRERIQELEKESIQQSKENYVLQNELDYENLRVSQLQTKQDKLKTDVQSTLKHETLKIDQIILKYENRLKDLQFKLNEAEILQTKQAEIERIMKERYEDEVMRLKGEVARLVDEKNMRVQQQRNNFVEERSQEKTSNEKLGAEKIKLLTRFKGKIAIMKRFYQLKLNSHSQRLDQQQMKDSFAVTDSNMQRIQQLEESIYRGQNDQSNLAKVIAKLLRYVQKKEPIKINLSGLINKPSLAYILTGLKLNTEEHSKTAVTELNLSKCNLDDEDLQQIYEHLRTDQGIKKLKLGNNRFTNLEPLMDLLMAKGKKLEALGIEGCLLDIDTLERLPQVLRRMDNLVELNISGVINLETSSYTDKVNQVLETVLTIKSLKALDVSKNVLKQESLEHLLYSLKGAQNIEALIMSSVGLTDNISDALLYMLSNQRTIKKLNISGNSFSPATILQVLKQLTRSHCSNLEDLDLSKCKFNNDQQCYNQLAELIKQTKTLKSLTLQKVNLNDTCASLLINPIKEALNIQTLKLDYNQLGFTFIERLVHKMINNKLYGSLLAQTNNSSASSLLESDTSRAKQLSSKHLQSQGLIYLSLEGNNIGDKGATAVASLIKNPCQNTKKLSHVNLNQCGISIDGVEELRTALHQRANLAASANLSHVKITIERNDV